MMVVFAGLGAQYIPTYQVTKFESALGSRSFLRRCLEDTEEGGIVVSEIEDVELVDGPKSYNFTAFPRLPLEIQRLIWQKAQPQRMVQAVFNDGRYSCYFERPNFTPRVLHKVCRESRLETLKTFTISSTSHTLVDIAKSYGALGVITSVDGLPGDQPHKLQDRTSWFELGRDIIYWNGKTFTPELWDDLLSQTSDKFARLQTKATKWDRLLTSRGVGHVMLRADTFAGGYWQINQFMSCFPNLKTMSVLVGGLTVLRESVGQGARTLLQRGPLCVLADMENEAQMDQVSSNLPRISPTASDLWEGVRRHTTELRYDYRAVYRNMQNHDVVSDLMYIGYFGCCRNRDHWNGELGLIREARVTEIWRTERKLRKGAQTTLSKTDELLAIRKRVAAEMPQFRQVFLLRIYDWKLDTFGLDEIVF